MTPVLFGHQSVGQNLLDGLRDLAASGLVTPPLLDPLRLDQAPSGLSIASFRVGRNQDPASKIVHFSSVVRAELARAARIALFKFCYVDIDDATDQAKLFDEYRHATEAIEAARPELILAHVTVPLRSVATGPLTTLRHLLGRHHAQVRRNAARHHFNETLRRHFPAQRLFDLAAIESRGPDGAICLTPGPQGPVPMLARAYTNDGGHLNAVARRSVAREFIAFLARLRDSAATHAIPAQAAR